MSEVVVVRIGELRLGVPAAEIVDVVHLAPSDIAPLPVARVAQASAFCKGVATVEGRTVSMLDMEKILSASRAAGGGGSAMNGRNRRRNESNPGEMPWHQDQSEETHPARLPRAALADARCCRSRCTGTSGPCASIVQELRSTMISWSIIEACGAYIAALSQCSVTTRSLHPAVKNETSLKNLHVKHVADVTRQDCRGLTRK